MPVSVNIIRSELALNKNSAKRQWQWVTCCANDRKASTFFTYKKKALWACPSIPYWVGAYAVVLTKETHSQAALQKSFQSVIAGFEVSPFAAHGSLIKSQQGTHTHALTYDARMQKNVAIAVAPNTARTSTQTHRNLARTSTLCEHTNSSVRSARSKVIKCTKYFARDLVRRVSYIPCTKCLLIKKGLR